MTTYSLIGPLHREARQTGLRQSGKKQDESGITGLMLKRGQAGGALPNKSDFDKEAAGMMVGAVMKVCLSLRSGKVVRTAVEPSRGATVIL
jgi:hypothetical protein